jgi:hypothetical protein
VQIEQTDGHRVKVSIPEFKRLKAATLARQIGFFGTGAASLFRIGPHPELIGRPVASLGARAGGPLKAQIIDPGVWRNLNPDASVVPTHVKGTLSGGAPGGHDLAFALNGRVVAVAKSFAPLSGGRKLNFAVLVPDDKLRKGDNRLEVFDVQGAQVTKIGQAG